MFLYPYTRRRAIELNPLRIGWTLLSASYRPLIHTAGAVGVRILARAGNRRSMRFGTNRGASAPTIRATERIYLPLLGR